MKLKDLLMKANHAVRHVEDWILAIIMLLMTVLLVYNVVLRLLFSNSLQFAEEAGSFLLVSVCYLGSISAVRKSKHIRMVLLSDHLSFRGAYVLTLVNQIVPAVAFFFFSYLCFQILMVNYNSGRTFMTFQMDRWIIWVPVVIGLFGTGLQYLTAFFYNLVDHKNMTGKQDIWIGSELKFGDSTAS